MRTLIWFTLGFGGACALLAYGQGILFPAVLTAAALAVLAGFLARKSKWGLFFLGFALGLAWFLGFDRLYLAPAEKFHGTAQSAAIRASDFSYETDYGSAVDGRIRLEGKTYRVRAYLDEDRSLSPGDVLEGTFRFRVTTPEGGEDSTYHQGSGIFLLAYQADELAVSKGPASWRDLPAKLRRQIKTALEASFPPDTAPFAKALLLGDTGDLDYETDTSFKLSGIRHVVAVSGLHVSILFALIGTVTLRKRFLTAMVGFPVLALFAAVAGFTPSVTRACIMSGLMLLGMLADKEYDGGTALAFASLVMLVCNPLVITSVSFQLSVGSVAGIFCFGPGIQKWMRSFLGDGKKKPLSNWVLGSVSVTLSAMTLTTPLCAWYFGTVSLVGVVTNLLTLWVISFVFYGLMAVCLVYFLWPAGAALLAGIVSLPIRYVLLAARTLARFPLAAVYTRSPYIRAWLVFVYVLLVLFLLSKRKKPALLSCCACLGLCAALLASWAEPMLYDTRLTVLDVGQGQCLLLQSEGRTYMVDCGGDSDNATANIAAETLLSQGIGKLDGLILTHCDRDHAGAAENLLTRVDTDLLVLPPVTSDLAEHTGGRVVYAAENLSIAWGNTKMTVYAPTFPGNSNENSLCLLFDTEKCDILITGDRNGFGERMLLRSADLPKVDVLMAGHHGSKNSTCDALLQAVQPEIVCISVGEDNSYGHPAPELLERLQKAGCAVLRTDKHGDIVIRR